MLTAWLRAFFLTQIIELPIYTWALQKNTRAARYKILLVAFGASAITHPFVWFAFPPLCEGLPYWQYLLFAETFAVVVEAVYLHFFGVRWAGFVSFLANGLSATTGLAINYFKGVLS